MFYWVYSGLANAMSEFTVTAFTGHVLVVGGRAVRVPPPGALAESAPRRAPRVREGDTFFILVTPDETTHAPAPFYEALAQLGADVYFGSGGGITGGLRDALAAINAQLLADETPRQVHALALVLRDATLYAARSGSTFSALLQWPDLALFPTERHDPLSMNLRPLGADPEPDIQLTRYTVAPGQALLVADASLLPHSDDDLRTALSAENVAGIVERVKALAGNETAASVIRFTAPDAPDLTGIAPQPSGRAPRATPPRPVTPPEAPPADPPRQTPPFTAEDVPPPRPETDASSTGTVETTPFPAQQATANVADHAGDAATETDPGEADAPAAEPLAARAGAFLARLRAASSIRRRSGPSRLRKAVHNAGRTGRNILRGALAALLVVINGIGSVLERLIPTPGEDGRQGIPTNIAIGVAVLIPFVIVIVVVGLALSEQGKGKFQTYLERAKATHQEALELSGDACDNPALRPLWVEVQQLAEQAGELRPNDQDVLVISADARNYLDCYDKVERRNLTLLHEFADNAKLVGPIVNGGVDLYTLDRANGRIYHDTLSESGDTLTTRNNTPILYTGQVISNAKGNFTVGEIIDIEWLTAGGTAHDNVLIALDTQGQLLSYSPTFFADAQQLVTEGRWVRPAAIAVFRSNVYVLDTGANQIWRYVPPAGERAYSNAPEEYFNGATLPDLSNAVDFGISDEGAVYVLFADGTIKRYRRNVQSIVEEQPFELREAPPGVLTSGVALFVDNDPLSRQLYIVDPETAAIYETLWGGKFRRGYRPANMPDAFDEVSGIYADAVVRNAMYVVADNKLYHFKRNP